MEKRIFYFALIAVLVSSPFQMALAEEGFSADPEDTEIETLPTFVFVSTRTPLSLDRLSPSATYIGEDAMRFWQNRDLGDVLNQQNGLALIRSGGLGAQTSLFTRGSKSDHTSFFVEGRRLNPGLGNQYGLDFQNLGNVGSVQLQRGASSVQYGSSGIGGVIDLRLASGLGEVDPAGSLQAEFGSNHYTRTSAEVRYGSDRFGLSLSGAMLRTDNERDNDRFESDFINGRFDYKLTDPLRFELLGLFSDSEKELPNSIFSPKADDVQTTKSWLLSPGIRYATDELSVHLFYARSENSSDFDLRNEAFDPMTFTSLGFVPVSNTIDLDSDELSLQVDYSLSDDALFTFGGVYRRDQASNTNLNTFSPLDPAIPYRQTFRQHGAYGQLLYLIGDLELRAGLRYDDYSEFDHQTTGNFEIIYNFKPINAAVFAKVATSYAPPSAASIAFDSNDFFSDPDTKLQPEESTSYEIGWRHSLFGGDLDYSVVLFRNELKELIDFVFDPDTFNSDAINVEKGLAEGVEFQANYRGIKNLTLGLGYTYLTALGDFQDDPRTPFVFGSPNPAKDVRLARRPRHLLQLSADYRVTPEFNLGIHAVGHFDRMDFNQSFVLVDAEDYFVVRVLAEWKLNQAWSVFGRVENLLDESYAPAAGFPALGRAGYLGARFRF